MKELTQIPFHDTTIYTTADGAYVALRPVCEALGLDVHSQRHRLQRQSWATEVMMTSVAADGKVREMVFIDRRTFTMWLATIDTGRIGDDHTRELVRIYQCEAADALDKYFNEGAAINPRAAEETTRETEDRRLRRARQLVELHMLAQGVVAQDYLESKIRIILAKASDEIPEIEAGAHPLYIQDYLREKGATRDEVTRFASAFGRYVKEAYKAERGVEPGKRFDETPSGQVRETYAYTETDRPIFDRAWSKSYADGFPEKRARKSKEKK